MHALDSTMEACFRKLDSKDTNEQYVAMNQILDAIDHEVDWAYEVWEGLVEGLASSDAHKRSRSAQFLCGLAKSDPERRMLHDFPKLWQVTYDDKFVTARHTLQAIWKVGLSGEEQKRLAVGHLAERYRSGNTEKNGTLIRFDILQGLRRLYDAIGDPKLKDLALSLIDEEQDPKYKKKYSRLWKNI